MTDCAISNVPLKLGNINFSNITKSCSTNCNFEYNYVIGNPVITNKDKYLDIKLNTENSRYEIKSVLLGRENKAVKGKVLEARIYCPSINEYGNDIIAELIIIHQGNTTSKRLSLCIPIKKTSSSFINETTTILNTIAERAPNYQKDLSEQDRIPLTFPNFTLNKLIPTSKYIIYKNAVPSWDCNNNNNVIFFDKSEPLFISNAKYNILRLKLKESGTVKNTVSESVLEKNTIGTKGPGINHKPQLHCYPIDINGRPIKQKKIDEKSDAKKEELDLGVSIYILIALVAGFILFYGVRKLVQLLSKSKSVVGSGVNNLG
jgi:hypothetical protein